MLHRTLNEAVALPHPPRCTDGVESWADELRESSPKQVEEAVEWVGETPVQGPQPQGSLLEALTLALEHSKVD